jgi:hypothetical protein
LLEAVLTGHGLSRHALAGAVTILGAWLVFAWPEARTLVALGVIGVKCDVGSRLEVAHGPGRIGIVWEGGCSLSLL